MRWFEALSYLTQAKTPLVMVTVVSVRGHAPREAGAKMLVTANEVYGTVGGGNLEAIAIALARKTLSEMGNIYSLAPTQPIGHTIRLTETAEAEYGVQCCGGEVALLLEPVVAARPTVAIFGVGHVGLALAKVLSICPLDLWLIDSRTDMLSPERLASLQPAGANIKAHDAPILDGLVGDLPAGSHLLIMTHDHAEDIAVLDAALRRADLGYIGLIGSRVKWSNFRGRLKAEGFSENDLSRVTTPIGIPGISGKAPEAIAIAVAAQLMQVLEGQAITLAKGTMQP